LENFKIYIERFFSLSNPLLFGVLIASVVAVVIILFFLRVFLPLQKKRLLEKQKHKLEKAELMALFSELDPSPQIRINSKGIITQTNRAARNIFPGIDSEGKNINYLLPNLKEEDYKTERNFIETVSGNIFSISIKPGEGFDFINIYLHDITKQKNYETSLEDYKNKLKDLAEKLDTSIEDVKKTVSRELHDDIGHSLMALKLKASHDNVEAESLLGEITTVYEKVRELSRELRPADITKLGLITSIQSLVDTMSKSTGIAGLFEHNGREIESGNDIATCLVRVTQEALSNIAKHSGATEFTVGLTVEDDSADLIVVDNGKGIPEKYFDPKNYKNFGIGLFNLKERVEKYKGKLRINSNGETGTVLIIQIPLKEM